MKSWISFLLPKDEYKEKMMLYFYFEGVMILLLSLIGMVIYNHYFDISVMNTLLISIVIFLFYIAGRYIMSGIAYTDVTTYQRYKKEVKETISHIIIFFILMSLYLIIVGLNKWIEVLSLALSIGIVWFLADFISLKRSYNKNKDLL